MVLFYHSSQLTRKLDPELKRCTVCSWLNFSHIIDSICSLRISGRHRPSQLDLNNAERLLNFQKELKLSQPTKWNIQSNSNRTFVLQLKRPQRQNSVFYDRVYIQILIENLVLNCGEKEKLCLHELKYGKIAHFEIVS